MNLDLDSSWSRRRGGFVIGRPEIAEWTSRTHTYARDSVLHSATVPADQHVGMRLLNASSSSPALPARRRELFCYGSARGPWRKMNFRISSANKHRREKRHDHPLGRRVSGAVLKTFCRTGMYIRAATRDGSLPRPHQRNLFEKKPILMIDWCVSASQSVAHLRHDDTKRSSWSLPCTRRAAGAGGASRRGLPDQPAGSSGRRSRRVRSLPGSGRGTGTLCRACAL